MAKDSIGILIVEALVLLTLTICWRWFSWDVFLFPMGICVLLVLFTMFFFRDPNRTVQKDKNVILSPADGQVVEIGEVNGASFATFLKGRAKKVAIFLSVWDVHINRIPVSGNVEFVQYHSGSFRPAYESEAGSLNEQMWIGIQNEHGKILVKQIAGILARRIVCRLREKDHVVQGDRFGMIKFGSRVELFFPVTVSVKVKIGDPVKAGQSIIGEFVHAK